MLCAVLNRFEFIIDESFETRLFFVEQEKTFHFLPEILLRAAIQLEKIMMLLLDGWVLYLDLKELLLCDLPFAHKGVTLVGENSELVLDWIFRSDIISILVLLLLSLVVWAETLTVLAMASGTMLPRAKTRGEVGLHRYRCYLLGDGWRC